MRNYWSLTRVLLKNNMGIMGTSKMKWTVLLYGFLIICLLPMCGVLYLMFSSAMESLQMLDQSGSVLALGFHLSSLVTFIFSIFLIPSIFYFSSDNQTLLSLPLKPQTILSGKLTVCLLYEYAFTLMILVPLFFAYLHNVDVSPLFYIFAVLIFLTMPIYPLILSSIIAMVVMRFVPFFKNRDRFNMIAGILSVGLAFGFSYFFNSRTIDENPDALILLLTSGHNSLIQLFSVLFPGVPFASEALINGDIVQMLIYAVICVAAVVVFLTLGKYLYFKGVVGFSETSSSKKKLSDQDMAKQNQKRNVTLTYMMKELKLLVRTPIYFLNCIGMCFLMPIMLLIFYFTGNFDSLLTSIPHSVLIQLDGKLPYAIMIGFAAGFFFSNLNLISSTSISREGTNISFMKYIPMSLGKQLHAKVYSGIVMSLVSLILSVICIALVVPIFPVSYYIAATLSASISIILGNYLGILIDIFHPKLVWEQEAAAVKQNLCAVIAMLLGVALGVAVGVLVYQTPYSAMLYVSLGITVVFLISIVVLYRSLEGVALRKFKNY